ANGIRLEYETFGNPTRPPLLLIMGLGGQLIHWPDEFCQALARAGHYVIRYDNRDSGLSSRVEYPWKIGLVRASAASWLGLPIRAPYTLDDMADDALGLLDALKLSKVHVVGISMGGMIGQILAARHPERVKTFVSLMSSSGNPRLPGPSFKLRVRLATPPILTDRESAIRYSMETLRLIGSPKYPADEKTLRAKTERSFDRSGFSTGLARQTLAIIASGNRVSRLKQITAPTLIIHGSDDPLIPVAAAYDLARHIPGAQLTVIPGMGHDLPAPLLPQLVDLILSHVRESEVSPSQQPVHGAWLPATAPPCTPDAGDDSAEADGAPV
ncbi:MAG: alpha/beta fold hydrolase, partial [Nevskiales bacterium]|nr:alpha/beta fold hydrolase [Nevskiales bacterium]